MVWFPGEWFGYIITGYPVINPESLEFVIRILLPFCAGVFLIVYSLRDRKKAFQMATHRTPKGAGKPPIVKPILILSCGALVGFVLGFLVIIRYQESPENTVKEEVQWVNAPKSEFKDFCRHEGFKYELEALIDWVQELQVEEIAILYNGEDQYSKELYEFLLENFKDDKVTVSYSEMFKKGEKFFNQALKGIESSKPEAIVFLGSPDDRLAFLENITDQEQDEFWKDRIEKIMWMQ
jgi:hypothetical protein